MSGATKYGCKHDEAFCLMWYRCTCGHKERIWNSRDGVTPFMLTCPSCNKPSMQHVDWNQDVYTPDHKLSRYQKFWRDGTPDEAEAIMRRRIEAFRDKYPVDAEYEKELIRCAREGKDQDGMSNEFQEGWPTLDIHNPMEEKK